jgi:quercetin dioxygenase-like cupin family protein
MRMPEMPDELAGEFALGMLEEEERMVVERRMRDEPEFRRTVDFWSRRLIPLLDKLPSLTPPASVWAAIRGRLGDPMPPSSRQQSEGAWLNIAPGVQLKMLHVDPVTGDRSGLMRMGPGSVVPEHDHRETEECFVLEGGVNINGQDYSPDDYTIAYAGTRHDAIRSAAGVLLFLHWGALPAAT